MEACRRSANQEVFLLRGVSNIIIIKSLDPLRAKKTFIKKKEVGPYHGFSY